MAHDTILIKMLASHREGAEGDKERERGRGDRKEEGKKEKEQGKETGNLASLSLSWDEGEQHSADLSQRCSDRRGLFMSLTHTNMRSFFLT